MNDNTRALIEQLSAKLGTTADHIMTVLVHQAALDASVSLVVAVILIVGYSWGMRALLKKFKADEDYMPGVIIYGLFGLAVLGTLYYIISNVLAGFFNPEYWALQEIFSRIKK